MPDRGKLLLDGQRRRGIVLAPAELLDVGRDVNPAIDGTLAPSHHAKKFADSALVCTPRMRIADVGREEFEKAEAASLAGDDGGRGGVSGDGDELVH